MWAFSGAAVLVAGGLVVSRLFSRPHDPDETERFRRTHLNQIGRIVEGHVIELMEIQREAVELRSIAFRRVRKAPADNAPPDNHRKVVSYSYSISGVSYETAQDITGLEEHACLDRLVSGQPASVKYDPSNPSDSILVADDWSGLR